MNVETIQEELKIQVDLSTMFIPSVFADAVNDINRIPTSAVVLCKSGNLNVDGFTIVEMLGAIEQSQQELEGVKKGLLNIWKDAIDEEKTKNLPPE